MRMRMLVVSFVCVGLLLAASTAQDIGTDRNQLRQRLMERFDVDGDGTLSSQERAELRKFLQARRSGKRGTGPEVNGAGIMPESKPSTLTTLYGERAPEVKLISKNLEWKDETRDKSVPLRVTYPSNVGGKLSSGRTACTVARTSIDRWSTTGPDMDILSFNRVIPTRA